MTQDHHEMGWASTPLCTSKGRTVATGLAISTVHTYCGFMVGTHQEEAGGKQEKHLRRTPCLASESFHLAQETKGNHRRLYQRVHDCPTVCRPYGLRHRDTHLRAPVHPSNPNASKACISSMVSSNICLVCFPHAAHSISEHSKW